MRSRGVRSAGEKRDDTIAGADMRMARPMQGNEEALAQRDIGVPEIIKSQRRTVRGKCRIGRGNLLARSERHRRLAERGIGIRPRHVPAACRKIRPCCGDAGLLPIDRVFRRNLCDLVFVVRLRQWRSIVHRLSVREIAGGPSIVPRRRLTRCRSAKNVSSGSRSPR